MPATGETLARALGLVFWLGVSSATVLGEDGVVDGEEDGEEEVGAVVDTLMRRIFPIPTTSPTKQK